MAKITTTVIKIPFRWSLFNLKSRVHPSTAASWTLHFRLGKFAVKVLHFLKNMKILAVVILSLLAVDTAWTLEDEAVAGGFREVGLHKHNQYREKKHLKPLHLDNELNVLAQAHSERLASERALHNSDSGYDENLWGHTGTLRPLRVDVRDAVNNWYTGNAAPGHTESKVDKDVLSSDSIRFLGIGVGTADNYTVVVANYA